jgi:hypothetical protein
MKRLVLGACIASTAFFVAGEANAVATHGSTYVFYSGTQVIGQSLLYCNNDQKHWGDASQYNLNNAVAVTYSCSDGTAIHVGYPANIDPWVKSNFCSQTGLCEAGPWPTNGAPALQTRLWSD